MAPGFLFVAVFRVMDSDRMMQAAERVDYVILIIEGHDFVSSFILQQIIAVVDVPEAAAKPVDR